MGLSVKKLLLEYFNIDQLKDALYDIGESVSGNKTELINLLISTWREHNRSNYELLDKEFSREKETIEYSSKSYIPDFTFKRINTIVEVKLCKTADKEKRIISEINDDIVAYNTKYENLIFVVYDLGMIRNVDRFKNSLESNEHVIVKVIKQ